MESSSMSTNFTLISPAITIPLSRTRSGFAMRRKPEHGHREHRTPLRLLTFHLAHFRYCVGTGLYTQASSGLMYGSPGCTPEKTTKVRSVSMAPWHLSANLQVD